MSKFDNKTDKDVIILQKGQTIQGYEHDEGYYVQDIFLNEKGDRIYSIWCNQKRKTILVTQDELDDFYKEESFHFNIGDIVTYCSSRFHINRYAMVIVDVTRTDFEGYMYITKPLSIKRGYSWMILSGKDIVRYIPKFKDF